MIQDVEKLGTELHIESLRDTANVVVLEQGEIQLGDARARNNIPPRIAAQVVAVRKHGCDWRPIRWLSAGRELVAIRLPPRKIGRCWDAKAVRLDVVVRIPRIGQGPASRTA